MYAVIGIPRNMQVFNYLLENLKYRLHVNVQCNYSVCVCTRMRTSARVCACVTIVVHTLMYAVIGILRNMPVFNYLLRNLKCRLPVHVQCNYSVCV